jgi:hypothetical protein
LVTLGDDFLVLVRQRLLTGQDMPAFSPVVARFCCIWSTGGMPKPCQPMVQIAKASSSNATATRRVTGSSTASS